MMQRPGVSPTGTGGCCGPQEPPSGVVARAGLFSMGDRLGAYVGLILAVVLIVCMLFWLFAALPVPASAPYAPYHPLVAWICVAILCYLVIGGGRLSSQVGLVTSWAFG